MIRLTNKGVKRLIHFICDHGNENVVMRLTNTFEAIDAWTNEIDDHGRLEMEARFTMCGNPVTIKFDADYIEVMQ